MEMLDLLRPSLDLKLPSSKDGSAKTLIHLTLTFNLIDDNAD